MTDKIKTPFVAGDVVILNSSPDVPMTVYDCFAGHRNDSNGNVIFSVNVTYLDVAGHEVRNGFPHNVLSLYRPVTDFIQPIGFKRDTD